VNPSTLIVSSYAPRRCGIGAYAHAMAERLRASGEDVSVLSPPDGDGDVGVRFDGGRPFRVAARMGGRFDRIQVHFQPALYYRPRAAWSKVLTSASLLWLVRRRPQTEVVMHEADRPIRWRPDYVLLRRALLRTHLAFHTEAERRRFEQEYRINARARIVDHSEAVSLSGPTVGRGAARERLGIPPGEVVLVCAGFLHPDKGYERAVRAFATMGTGRLVIVGSVRDRTPRNIQYARTLRELADRTPGVSLIESYVSDGDFDAWIEAADRLVLPYRRAWSSGALARARRLGTPAVVSSEGGLPDQAGPDDLVFGTDEELRSLLGQLAGDARRAGTGS
jgi:glycosyltransferase involved in cell wall biosynthesis